MKLLDLDVRQEFRGEALEKGAWYLRLELPDALDAWRAAGKMTVLEAAEILGAEAAKFLEAVKHFQEAVQGLGDVETAPTLWMDERGCLKMTARCLLQLGADATVAGAVQHVREEMKHHGVYLRVQGDRSALSTGPSTAPPVQEEDASSTEEEEEDEALHPEDFEMQ